MAKKQVEAAVEAEADVDFDFGGEAGAGLEGVRQSDLNIPFLEIVQALSPQKSKNHAKYIEGIDEGDIFLTTFGLRVGGPTDAVIFTPVSFRSAWVEWKAKRGGFVKQHDTEAALIGTVRNEKHQDVLPNGNIIVPTKYMCGYTEVEGRQIPSVIAFKSSQLKKAKVWLSILTNLQFTRPDGSKYLPPAYATRYALTTVSEPYTEGSAWGWKITPHGKNKDINLIESGRKMAQENRLLLTAGAAEGQSDAVNPSDVL